MSILEIYSQAVFPQRLQQDSPFKNGADDHSPHPQIRDTSQMSNKYFNMGPWTHVEEAEAMFLEVLQR